MKKKIAFLIRDLNYGGAERQLVTLAKALDKQCFDVTVLCFYTSSSFSLDRDLKDNNIPIIYLEKQGRWHLFSFFWRLVQHLQHIHPDVLHGYGGTPNLLTIFLKLFLPSTRMVWGLRNSYSDSNFYDWLGRLIFWLECILAKFADLIIVNSYAGKTYYVSHGFPPQKMMVISNGIDIELFQHNLEARTKMRWQWEISQDTILIGLVGRLDFRKDHPTFIKAAALLCEDSKNVHFVCVGGGSENYAQELHQLAEKLGIAQKIIWEKARADMPAIYNALDIVVSSSYTEGFPNVIGEAMACGVPCVVTDVGDSALIVDNPDVVVPPKNPEALKIAIKKLIEKLNIDGGDRHKIRQRIINHFSVAELVLQTEATLLKLCHESIN
ncbi:group 1 glycosyl transferase [Nostoc linckia z18]|uniref:Group 1 glycosyl transferase n=2 Tax=Nostoc linckia TaxID=92942 RepID=A0A9Q5ZEA2_NOSLI|nr:glycosyltransferase [Nostoc linckia]PHK38460.1 group 1 glycosyl transferase [Nostoc linckia z15]PHK47745.1 group 1 glycosyl transferase [Nostoc linckia z16]PHJ65963.1 group 1 glycosyl transferase [Nostoc linckia z1]PHJ68869.1 group 1 glycosyl transferase [Nostoc linckia z3]PHJ74520.1 group 1 glycosyl transferase [Nostoc linckia z2]